MIEHSLRSRCYLTDVSGDRDLNVRVRGWSGAEIRKDKVQEWYHFPELACRRPVTTYNELYDLHINLTLSNEGVPLHVSEQYSFHTVPLGSKSTRTRSRSSPFRKLTRHAKFQSILSPHWAMFTTFKSLTRLR